MHGDPSVDPNLLSATSVLGAEAVDGQQVELRDEVCPSLHECVCVYAYGCGRFVSVCGCEQCGGVGV